MLSQKDRIEAHMRVIAADGRLIGYVERVTDAEIITNFPCRRISLDNIRYVTDDVYITERLDELREQEFLRGPKTS